MTIYFIRSECGRIKIGYTAAPEPSGRLGDLQVGNAHRLECIAHCPGDPWHESELHGVLAKERVRGEWFEPSPRLASLLAYVAQFNTTAGWRDAEERPEAWARFVAEFGEPTRFDDFRDDSDPEVRWKLALEHASRKKPKRRVKKTDWENFAGWGVTESEKLPVMHETQEFDNFETEYGWSDGSHFEPNFSNAGQALTARMLASAKTREQYAAVWVAACVHMVAPQLRGGRQIEDVRFPEVGEFRRILERRLGDWWHHISTVTTPTHFALPKNCVVSVEEFIALVAQHRRATLATHSPVARWALGAHSSLPRKQAAA